MKYNSLPGPVWVIITFLTCVAPGTWTVALGSALGTSEEAWRAEAAAGSPLPPDAQH